MSTTKISKRLRFEVLRRDSHTCYYCGGQAPEVKLTVDHVIPEALGGPTEPANLVTACSDCNSGKTSAAPDQAHVENVDQAAAQWAAAIRTAAEQLRAEADAHRATTDRWKEAWDGWTYDTAQGKATVPVPVDWRNSIEAMLAAGADLDALIDLIGSAMRSKAQLDNVFRYYCGCGWNHVRDIQARAKKLLTLSSGETQGSTYATSPSDTVRDAYSEGLMDGYCQGHDAGWEAGIAAGVASAADRPRLDDPISLTDILQPPPGGPT